MRARHGRITLLALFRQVLFDDLRSLKREGDDIRLKILDYLRSFTHSRLIRQRRFITNPNPPIGDSKEFLQIVADLTYPPSPATRTLALGQ